MPQSPCLPLSRAIAATLLAGLLAGCASLGAAGPSTGAIRDAGAQQYDGAGISVVELDGSATARLTAFTRAHSFAEALGDAPATAVTLGQGDVVDLAIWEAAPAVLFGTYGTGGTGGEVPPGAQGANVPQQVVDLDGTISVPFIGRLAVSGQTPAEVERQIVQRLGRRANNPQVVLRVVENQTRNATVIGEVAQSRRVPLGPGGERLLDALALAGGPRHPVGKTTVQLSRDSVTAVMPLDAVIRDPAQNIRLRPDDVVTLLFQPYSFIALGAVRQNAEVPFEGSGFTLAQALGRIGGLRDDRADVHGVFVFRLEDPAALPPEVAAAGQRTEAGLVPVIYRLDLAQPNGFFAAQDFAVRDADVLYVSTAPLTDLQRFISTLSGFAFSAVALGNAVNGSAN